KDFFDGPQCRKLAGRMAERLHSTMRTMQIEEIAREEIASERLWDEGVEPRDYAINRLKLHPLSEKTETDIRFMQVAKTQFLKYLPSMTINRVEFSLYNGSPTEFFVPIAQAMNIKVGEMTLPPNYVMTLEIDPAAEAANPRFVLRETSYREEIG